MSLNLREQKFWRYLKRHFRTQNLVDFARIENSVSNSIPDIYFSSDMNGGVHGFVELKVLTTCKGGYSAPHFSEGQRKWIIREWLRGARPFILVRAKVRSQDRMYLLTAEAAREPFPWTEDTLDKYSIWSSYNLSHESMISLLCKLAGVESLNKDREYGYYME